MNPEFRRNLILELSTHRLIAMPVVVLLVFAAAELTGGKFAVATAGQIFLIGLLVLWGSRLTSECVLGEVAARTWDGQRMSALGPLAMTLGKLGGSAIYVWYGAALGAAAFIYGRGFVWDELARMLLLGLYAQAVAMFISLVALRLRPQRMRLQVTLAQLVALGSAGSFWVLLTWDLDRLSWYGMTFDYASFSLVTGCVFLGWAWLGIYRLMRGELQFRTWPLGWAAFTLFCAVYAAGFGPRLAFERFDVSGVPGAAATLRLLIAFVVASGLTWAAAYAEPKGFVRLRRWGTILGGSDYLRALQATPGWLPAALVALGIGIALVMTWLGSPDTQYLLGGFAQLGSLASFVAAVILFMLRDIGLMYLFTMDGRTQRGQLTILVYLTLLYAVFPTILGAVGLADWLPALIPHAFGNPVAIVLPVLLQVAVVAMLLAARWRRIALRMSPAA